MAIYEFLWLNTLKFLYYIFIYVAKTSVCHGSKGLYSVLISVWGNHSGHVVRCLDERICVFWSWL